MLRESPRWRKVLRDLWGNKTRSLLVVCSISVGVFALGMVLGARSIILRSLSASYQATNVASATIYAEPFDDELVRTVRALPGVAEAEGRRGFGVRVNVGPDQWRDLQVFALPDYQDIRINKVRPQQGAWPPPKGELLLERASLAYLGWEVGRVARVETADGQQHDLRVAGTAHDLTQQSAKTSGLIYGYVTPETAEWLGEPAGTSMNQLNIVVAERELDRDHIQRVAADVREEVEASGRRVFLTLVPEPGKFWADDHVASMLVLLGVLGAGTLFISAFLVINTIAALIAQQIPQLGVMKAIGASRSQLMAMYLGVVFVFGLASFAISVPLGAAAAFALVTYSTALLNFDSIGFGLAPEALAAQAAAGLALPLLAATLPVQRGCAITVREAIASRGLGGGGLGRGPLDRLVGGIRGLSRPVLVSIRNTFRRKGRLAMTTVTLVLGGSIFIAVLSVRDSLLETHADVFRSQLWNVQLRTVAPYPAEALVREAKGVPGVEAAEAWAYRTAIRVRADGAETSNLLLNGVPTDSTVLRPVVLEGRWLEPGDENALVIKTDVLRDEPDLKVGHEVTLKLDGKATTWKVVGLVRGTLAGPIAYARYGYLAGLVGESGKADRVQVVTREGTSAFEAQVTRELETRFKQAGLRIASIASTADAKDLLWSNFSIIVGFLLAMAALLAAVGGLGLMGTMSINVLERTREIGVMRAVGASDGHVLRIIIAEGVLIALLSWAAGSVLAVPLSERLSETVGLTFLKTPLSYTFSQVGAVIWLGLVLVIATLGSYLPAWNASRLTVRDVLAYE